MPKGTRMGKTEQDTAFKVNLKNKFVSSCTKVGHRESSVVVWR